MSDDNIEFEGVETNGVTVTGDSIGELAYLVPPDGDKILSCGYVEIETEDRVVTFESNYSGQIEISVTTNND